MAVTARQMRSVDDAHVLPGFVRRGLSHFPDLRAREETIGALRRVLAARLVRAEEETGRIRAGMGGDVAALEATLGGLLAELVDQCHTIGVEPAGVTLDDLQAAWPAVSDHLARHVRDREVLDGPGERELDAELLQRGMVMTKVADPVVETVRAIRDGLERAGQVAARAQAVRDRMASLDVYDVDAEITGWVNEYEARGLTGRYPEDRDSWPGPDAELVAALRERGIDLEEYES